MTEDNNRKSYKIEILGEGIKVNQSISKDVALQVLNVIMGGGDSNKKGVMVGKDVTEFSETALNTGRVIDPKTFMATKKPISDVEGLLV